MNTLFDLPESKSPRLLWMERYKVTVSDCEDGKFARSNYDLYTRGFGLTEDEALANLAIALGVKLWNEE